MTKITDVSQVNNIKNEGIRAYINERINEIFREYSINSLDEVGRFVIADSFEECLFDLSDAEFSERIIIAGVSYCHAVRMITDCFGEELLIKIAVENGDEM